MWSSCRSSSSTICSYIVDRSLIPNVWGRANVQKVTRDEGLVLVKMKEIHTKKNRIGFAVLPFYIVCSHIWHYYRYEVGNSQGKHNEAKGTLRHCSTNGIFMCFLTSNAKAMSGQYSQDALGWSIYVAWTHIVCIYTSQDFLQNSVLITEIPSKMYWTYICAWQLNIVDFPLFI